MGRRATARWRDVGLTTNKCWDSSLTTRPKAALACMPATRILGGTFAYKNAYILDRLGPMSLFTKKPLAALLVDAETTPLRRVLGPVHLTMLGIGAIIGSGIFVLTGVVAAQNAGPALVISMILAGIACAFAGLCYAEFASMIPVAGSAYTYAYATLGEIFAWIIGWDLILE